MRKYINYKVKKKPSHHLKPIARGKYNVVYSHDKTYMSNIVEPLNKGHIGASHFYLCREVVCSSEVQIVLTIWENEHLGP